MVLSEGKHQPEIDMRAYEMTEEEFIDFYMFEQECFQLQDEQEYREYRDMMNWTEEDEEEFWEQQAQRNVYDY